MKWLISQSYFGTLVKNSTNDTVGSVFHVRWLVVCQHVCMKACVLCLNKCLCSVFCLLWCVFNLVKCMCKIVQSIQYHMVIYYSIYFTTTHLMFVEFWRYGQINASYFVIIFCRNFDFRFDMCGKNSTIPFCLSYVKSQVAKSIWKWIFFTKFLLCRISRIMKHNQISNLHCMSKEGDRFTS